MNKQKYRLQLTPKETLNHLTAIASGLLAGGYFAEEIDATAAGVLLKLMNRVEHEINEGNTDRYIDEGDARRDFLPGSEHEKRKAWLKNPVFNPDSHEDE